MTVESQPAVQISAKDYVINGMMIPLYGVVKYLPSPLGDWLRWLVVRPFCQRLGPVRIYEGVTFWYPYRISIGRDVTLNEWVYLSGFGGLQIGNHVRIGHRTSIITSDHRHDDLSRPIHHQGLESGAVVIDDNVWIGCNVTILKNVRIGHGAIIAAGAVVTHDVPANSIYGGVPARRIGTREEGDRRPLS